MKKRIILSIIIFLVLIIGAVYFFQKQDKEIEKPTVNGNNNQEQNSENGKITSEFIQCLSEAGVVIYGSATCPACLQLRQDLGGDNIIKPIYVDCSGIAEKQDTERCLEEMQTVYVPEIQIKGELFEEWGSPEALAEATGCDN
jgi:hypothetical protein